MIRSVAAYRRRVRQAMRRLLGRIGPWRLAALVGVLLPAVAVAQNSKWVTTGVTGRLIYVPDPQGDRIPNFSMVGYGAGKRAIPSDIPVKVHIDPIAGDNTANIQNAINQVDRSVVAKYLPARAASARPAVPAGATPKNNTAAAQ